MEKNNYPQNIVDQEIAKYIKRKIIQPPALPPEPPQPLPPEHQGQHTQLLQQEQHPKDTSTRPTTRSQTKQRNQQILTQTTPIQAPPQSKTREKKYIVLPYSNFKAEKFATKLTKLVNETFPQVDMRVAFRAPNEIGMFPFKENVKDPYLKSLVVYKIKCETCGAEYIGKSSRIVFHRMKKHNNINQGKNKNKNESAIQMHREDFPSHKINALDFEILDRADSYKKLELKEMLHINRLKPT